MDFGNVIDFNVSVLANAPWFIVVKALQFDKSTEEKLLNKNAFVSIVVKPLGNVTEVAGIH